MEPMKPALRRKVLVSYDVAKADASRRSKVYRMVFGYEIKREDGRRYRYPGVLNRPGSRYVGQSVLLLEPAAADGLVRRLAKLGVNCSAEAVYLAEDSPR